MFDYASALEAALAGLGAVLFDTSLHTLEELTGTMVALTNWPLDDPPLGYVVIEPAGGTKNGRFLLERLGLQDASG